MLNLSVFSLTTSFLFASNSPLFVGDHYISYNCNFQRFLSSLFYNQKSLKIDRSTFSKGLGSVIINEYNEKSVQETFLNQEFSSSLQIENSIKSISIINCKFSDINGSNVISIAENEGGISLYITSSSFIDCMSDNGVIKLTSARCLTMTHICTYQSGSTSDNAEGSILWYDMADNDFLLCLYNTFVETSMFTGGAASVIDIKDGDQYFRCNNITGSSSKGFHFNSPGCFSFGLSTVVDCDNTCFMMAVHNNNNKFIEMSNFINKGSFLIEVYGNNPYILTMNQCLLLSQKENSEFANKDGNIKIDVINCLIMSSYQKTGNITFNNCTTVTYDETYTITLHAHYTNGAECIGPENVENNEENCEVGKCLDKICDKTIEFPTDVYQYTTICHHCTPVFSETSEFSESEKFSKSSGFSESEKFTKSSGFPESEKFSKSSGFSESEKYSKSSEIYESETSTLLSEFSKHDYTFSSLEISSPDDDSSFESFEPVIVDDPGKQGSEEKGTNKGMIGAIVGVLAVVVIAAVIATVLIIRKRRKLNVTTGASIAAETNNSEVTTLNKLNSEMKEDDPFADDFKGDEL